MIHAINAATAINMYHIQHRMQWQIMNGWPKIRAVMARVKYALNAICLNQHSKDTVEYCRSVCLSMGDSIYSYSSDISDL